MGYLSQRKNHVRFNLLLNIVLISLAIVVLLPFILGSTAYLTHVLSSYRFQYYLISVALIALSLYTRFSVHAILFLLVFLLNYFSISSNSNIFFNTTASNSQEIKIAYFNGMEDVDSVVEFAQHNNVEIIALNRILPDAPATNMQSYYDFHSRNKSSILARTSLAGSGTIALSPEYEASYVLYRTSIGNVIIMNIDFEGISFTEKDIVLQNLGDFILRQYTPVVVVGDFGVSTYSPAFKKFLIRTELSVKNRVILKDWGSISEPPTINILGYSSIGIKEITNLNKGFNQPAAFMFTLQVY